MNITSARKAAEFAQIWSRDQQDKASVVFVPGHDARRYVVYIERSNGNVGVRCTRQDVRADCKGNSNGHICYHAIAALLVAAGDQGCKLAFCKTEQAARNLANLGGKVLKVRSLQGKGVLWIVARSEEQPEQQTAENESVSAAQEFKVLWDRMMKPERLTDDELARYRELDCQFQLRGMNVGMVLNQVQREVEEAERENALPVSYTHGRNKLFKS